MTTWLPRGLVFAIGMVVLRLVQGTLINASPTNAGTISFALCAVLFAAALLWGVIDGIADARSNPDPDRRRDLAMRWLMAGLVAGVLSGLAAAIIAMFYNAIYAEGIGVEVTVFAAFTALLVFLPAIFGTGIGRWLVDRRRPVAPRQRMPGRLGEQRTRARNTQCPDVSWIGARTPEKRSGSSTMKPIGACTTASDRESI
jgi:MFS family permease